MATSRPFAYNEGSLIPGTEQIGNLAIGTPTSGFVSTGLKWWNGPDEDFGYVIAHQTPSGQPGADGETAYLGFWRSTVKTEESFIQLCSVVSNQSFASGNEAKIWLNDNGYWTSYVSLIPTPTPTPTTTSTPTPTPSSTPVAPVSSGLELYYDPSNPSSYPGSGTILYDLSSSAVNATIGGSPTLIDNAFTFAGSQSIITGDLSGLSAGWQHSLEIWFNASAIGAVFSDTGTGPTNTSYHTTGLEVYSAGPFYLTNAMLWKAVTGGVTRVGGGTVSLNNWYQLVRVYNGSNLAYAYLNKVKSSDTSITWGTPSPGWYLNFGSSETTNFATGAAFQGKIGVVRLYNRVLSLAEVTQNFNADKSKYGL